MVEAKPKRQRAVRRSNLNTVLCVISPFCRPGAALSALGVQTGAQRTSYHCPARAQIAHIAPNTWEGGIGSPSPAGHAQTAQMHSSACQKHSN